MGFRPDREVAASPAQVERLFIIDEELAVELAELARVTGDCASDIVRDAIAVHCDQTREDLERLGKDY